MGCDGGTIPKRKEIVKSKQTDERRDKNSDLSAKWQFCTLSGLRLKKPIVACQLGRLYNKESVIEYLLEHRVGEASSSSASHINSMKDVKELNLKEKPDFDTTHRATSGNEQFQAQFVCPISGLDVNGKYKFYFLWTCGCVFSERAFKEVPNEEHCIICSKTYQSDLDLIVLNGNSIDVENLKERIVMRRNQQKGKRKLGSSSLKELRGHGAASSSSDGRKRPVI